MRGRNDRNGPIRQFHSTIASISGLPVPVNRRLLAANSQPGADGRISAHIGRAEMPGWRASASAGRRPRRRRSAHRRAGMPIGLAGSGAIAGHVARRLGSRQKSRESRPRRKRRQLTPTPEPPILSGGSEIYASSSRVVSVLAGIAQGTSVSGQRQSRCGPPTKTRSHELQNPQPVAAGRFAIDIAADAGLQPSPFISGEVRAVFGPGGTPLRKPLRRGVLATASTAWPAPRAWRCGRVGLSNVGIASGSVPERRSRDGGAEHLIVEQ